MMPSNHPKRSGLARAEPKQISLRSTGEGAERGGSSTNLLAVVWERRWVILACMLASLTAGVVYIARTTPIYRSSSQIYIERNEPAILSEREITRGGRSAAETQATVIQSTAILTEVANQSLVRQTGALRGTDNPVAFLKSRIGVDVSASGDIMTVSLESPNPQSAATLVNAIVESYIDHQSDKKRSSATEVLKILQKEKVTDEGELDRLYAKSLKFQQQNGMITLQDGNGKNIATQRLAQLSDKLTQAEMQTLDAKIAYQGGESTDDLTELRHLVSDATLDDRDAQGPEDPFLQRLNQLRFEKAQLDGTYGPGHPRSQTLQRRIDTIQAMIRRQGINAPDQANQTPVQKYKALLKAQYDLAKQRQSALRENFEEQKKQALSLNTKNAEYQQIQAEIHRTERMLDTVATRIKELNLTGESGARNISVLEYAKPGVAPVKPKRARIVGLSMILGMMIGFVAAMLQDWMDQRLRSADEVASVLGRSVLGIVPHIRLPDGERMLAVHEQPNSETAEAYRTLRTAIHFGRSMDHDRTLVVTSPSLGEGKTTVASNLAVAFAQAGHRVVIVDADCRRPMLHRIFGVGDGVGLCSVLEDRADLGQAVTATQIENLSVIPCGPVPGNPSELLNSSAFDQVLAALREQYDQVIIDSPPVVPVTDARIVAASCEATLLVLRAGQSTRRPAQHANEALESVGAQVLGAVVNDVRPGKGGYGYYGKYGYDRYTRERDEAPPPMDNGSSNGHRKLSEKPASPRNRLISTKK